MNKQAFPNLPRDKPAWWPANQPWPPKDRRFFAFRRAGRLFFLFVLIVILLIGVVIGLMAKGFGYFEGPHIRMMPRSGPGFILVGILVFLLTIAFFIWASIAVRRMSRPLDELLKASGKVESGDYSVRVEEKGSRDVRALIRSFNAMAARLQVDNEKRRNMLADISHELRTPLTVIQGNVEGMLDGIYPTTPDKLRAVLEESKVLSRLVDDLRTMVLAESGGLQLKKESIDLAALIQDAVSGFRTRADAARVKIVTDLPREAVCLELDPARIREVLANLLTNALLHSKKGRSIHVGCTLVGSNNARRVEVFVADKGSGIPAEDLPYIFERFFKSRDSGGMGLGLAIARYIVEAHGGRIGAWSTPGQGTEIRFWLPSP
jgi:two-component system sensor histidine kinase BaeS